MKKLLSLLMATVMTASLFATTAFAATANVSADFSTTEVTVGDTFTVTIKSAEKTIYAEDVRLVADNFYTGFEVVSTLDASGRDRHRLPWTDEWDETNYTTLTENTLTNGISFTYLGATATTYDATTIAVVTLKALAAGTYTLNLEEYTNYTDASDHTGFDGVATTQQIVVKAAAPQVDETISVGEATGNETAGTETYEVTVGKDLIGAGVKAVLTNTAAEEGNQTQEVALTFDGWSGEARAVFNVVVKFLDYANAATTSLSIEKN